MQTALVTTFLTNLELVIFLSANYYTITPQTWEKFAYLVCKHFPWDIHIEEEDFGFISVTWLNKGFSVSLWSLSRLFCHIYFLLCGMATIQGKMLELKIVFKASILTCKIQNYNIRQDIFLLIKWTQIVCVHAQSV